MLARNIAKSMIERKHLNAWQLQKLLFYSQALSLHLNNTVLFDDDIEAWKDGPVVRDVFYLYKNGELQYANSVEKDNTIIQLILDYSFKYFGKNTGKALRNMTHIENGAWDRVVKEKNIQYFEIERYNIPLTYIKDEISLYPNIIEELDKAAIINPKYVNQKHINKLMEIL